MMWAKEERKRVFTRPRMALMTAYTVAICLVSLVAFAAGASTPTKFTVTQQEAEAKIAEAIAAEGVEGDLQANIIGRRTTDLVTHSEILAVEVSHLELSKADRRFSAVLDFHTEAKLNHPSRLLGRMEVAGRYDEMVDVPVVKFRLGQDDIIRKEDIEWQKLSASRLKRDTLLDVDALIGKSPVRTISDNRPIREHELQNPVVVDRYAPVQMVFATDHISIRAVGTALQDGSVGEKIKVRNDDSGAEISAVVLERGKVRVLPAIAMPVKMSMK